MTFKLLAALALAAAAVPAVAIPSNLVANGGFEDVTFGEDDVFPTFGGWTNDGFYVVAHSDFYGTIEPFAGDISVGTICAESLCTLSQSIKTVAGQRYALGFAYNPGVAADTTGGMVQVSVASSVVATLSGGDLGWASHHLNFTATGDATQLTFAAMNVGGGNGLDAVTVVPGVPEPATWGMMVAGFGLAGIALRRRAVARVA